MATTKGPKVSARDRARWKAQARALQDAETDTEIPVEDRQAFIDAINERRASHGRPPMKPGWDETPPT